MKIHLEIRYFSYNFHKNRYVRFVLPGAHFLYYETESDIGVTYHYLRNKEQKVKRLIKFLKANYDYSEFRYDR